MKYLGIMRGSAETEATKRPDDEAIAKMGAFIEEAMKSGTLLDTAGLKPSSEAIRFTRSRGRTTVTDGPFTEAKELIASYALLNYSSRDEAVEWMERFIEVLGGGDVELELWPIMEWG
jgi:hypothetical protein